MPDHQTSIPLPSLVVVEVDTEARSFTTLEFAATGVTKDREIVRLTGTAERLSTGDGWDCRLDVESREKVSRCAYRQAEGPDDLIDRSEDQIANAIFYQDPLRPEVACGMQVMVQDVSLVDAAVMAIWGVYTPNGGHVICALPVIDEHGQTLDRQGVRHALQWILRSEEPMEKLLPRLMSAVEAEGRRLLLAAAEPRSMLQ